MRLHRVAVVDIRLLFFNETWRFGYGVLNVCETCLCVGDWVLVGAVAYSNRVGSGDQERRYHDFFRRFCFSVGILGWKQNLTQHTFWGHNIFCIGSLGTPQVRHSEGSAHHDV